MTDVQTDNAFHLERFKKDLPHKSYIAGFIDGDGTIFIRKLHTSETGHQSGITIT